MMVSSFESDITHVLLHTKKTLSPGGMDFARNQIVRVAMFLHNAKLPLLVVQENPLLVV